MALFIKFDGIDGESQDKDHKGWSDLLSFTWGLHQDVAATESPRRRGKVVLEDVVVHKEMDKSDPKLAEAVCLGKIFPKVEIHDTRAFGHGNREVFLKYELRNLMVSSHNVSAGGDGDAVPTETVSLKFEEVKQTYVEFDAKGNKKGNVEMSCRVTETSSKKMRRRD